MVLPVFFWIVLKASHGNSMMALFTRMAIIAPGAEAFQIHQVVAAFHMRKEKYRREINLHFPIVASIRKNKGTHAKKINAV